MLQDIFARSAEVGSIIMTYGSPFMRNSMKARVHKEALSKRGIWVVAIQQEVRDNPTGASPKVFEPVIGSRARRTASVHVPAWPERGSEMLREFAEDRGVLRAKTLA